MAWTEHPIFFLDFEGSQGSGVLEYGMALLQGGRIVETRTRLCGATGRVRAEDTAVHGLSERMLGGARPFSEDWELFAGWRERGPLAAHYSGVENGMLKAVWPYPRRSPDFVRPGAWVIDWGPWIDSARLCSQFAPRLESGRLETLVAEAGVRGELDALAESHCPPPRRRFHAALYDALAGALLLASLGRDPRCAGLSLGQVIALSTLDPEKREGFAQREFW